MQIAQKQKIKKSLHAYWIFTMLGAALVSSLWRVYSSGVTAYAAPNTHNAALANSMQRKVEYVTANGGKESPESKETIFLQDEINAYFAERRLKIPEGVKSVTFDLRPGLVTANAKVDFDEITRERRSRNPLMHFFTGLHDVEVVARTQQAGSGMVHVSVESVAIDGLTVPKIALELFVERFVNPKFPSVGLDRDYRLPAKMKSAIIGERTGTIKQG
jgi:hypothetical protein